MGNNLRLYHKTPRNTPTFKAYYDKRSSAERVFKREKNDYKLTQFRTRSKGRQLFYAMLIVFAVHIDAWFWQDQAEQDTSMAA